MCSTWLFSLIQQYMTWVLAAVWCHHIVGSLSNKNGSLSCRLYNDHFTYDLSQKVYTPPIKLLSTMISKFWKSMFQNKTNNLFCVNSHKREQMTGWHRWKGAGRCRPINQDGLTVAESGKVWHISLDQGRKNGPPTFFIISKMMWAQFYSSLSMSTYVFIFFIMSVLKWLV